MVTRTDKALYAALFAILLWLVVYPNAFILVRSFFPAKQFTLANYQNFADWQTAFFGSTNLPAAAPDADPDSDGAVNQMEFLVGTNPLLGGDAWRISIQSDASSTQIRFPRLANRAFEVQWSTNLQEVTSWVALDQPENRPFFSSTNGQAVIEAAIMHGPARFYRVRVYEP